MSEKTAIANLNEAYRQYNNAVQQAPADTSPQLTEAARRLERAIEHPDLPADRRP